MTRKDYVEVARILNQYRLTSVFDEQDEQLFADLVDNFSYFFEKDNPRFDSTRFVQACVKELVVS